MFPPSTLCLGTARGNTNAGGQGSVRVSPNASFSASRLQEEIQLKEEAENNLAAFRAVSKQVPTLPGHLCPPCPLLKQPVPITGAWPWA